MGETVIAKKDDDDHHSNIFQCQVTERPQQLNEKMGKKVTVSVLLLKNIISLSTMKE